MTEKREVKQWITVRGKHIPIFEGESKSDAIVRAMDKDMERNPEMKKINDAVVEHSNKVAEKERNKREYELKKKDKEITDREAREKLRNQIDKDNDEKEKQIKQNEKEKNDLNDLFAHMSKKTHEFDNANVKRKEALGGLYKYTQMPVSRVPTEKLMDIVDKLDDAKINSDFYAKEIKKRHDDKMRAHAKSRLPKWK